MTTSKLPELYEDFNDADIERLMKRCQNGVGGRPSMVYAQANDLAAECYGTIGRLHMNGKAYRARMEALRDALQVLLIELSTQPNVLISDATLMQCSESIAACARQEAGR